MRIAALLALFCVHAGAQWATGYYYGNWGQPVNTVPYSKYTHVIYAFMAPNDDGTLNTSSVYIADLPAFVSGAHAAGAKALIGLGNGGWSGSTNSGTRPSFVSNIKNFINQYNLDGVDLDWEQSIDDSQYSALMKDLRVALGSSKVITMAAYGGFSNSPLASVVLAGPGQVDQINLMTYDMDIYEAKSWYNTAIHSGPNGEWSIEATINQFVGKGIPVSKLGIGIPFYGHHYSGPTGINQNKGSEIGAWVNYSEIVTGGRLSAAQYDSKYGSDYLSYPSEFWPFTGQRQIADIVAYGKSRGVGGYMAFDLNMEYIASASGDARTPLSAALRSTLGGGSTPTPTPVPTPTPTPTPTPVPTPVDLAWKLSPISGSGTGRIFSLSITDPSAAANIQQGAIMLGSGCYVGYWAPSATFSLDKGGTATYPSKKTLYNANCSLHLDKAAVTTSGNTMTIKFPVTFYRNYSGVQSLLVWAANTTKYTGWKAAGTFTVAY